MSREYNLSGSAAGDEYLRNKRSALNEFKSQLYQAKLSGRLGDITDKQFINIATILFCEVPKEHLNHLDIGPFNNVKANLFKLGLRLDVTEDILAVNPGAHLICHYYNGFMSKYCDFYQCAIRERPADADFIAKREQAERAALKLQQQRELELRRDRARELELLRLRERELEIRRAKEKEEFIRREKGRQARLKEEELRLAKLDDEEAKGGDDLPDFDMVKRALAERARRNKSHYTRNEKFRPAQRDARLEVMEKANRQLNAAKFPKVDPSQYERVGGGTSLLSAALARRQCTTTRDVTPGSTRREGTTTAPTIDRRAKKHGDKVRLRLYRTLAKEGILNGAGI